MCGITGTWSASAPGDGLSSVVAHMNQTLVHRGPDAGHCWVDEGNGLALGQRRLAIVDLSQAGLQPMHSHRDRFVIVFNGEIYNHHELREQLESERGAAIAWRGTSDTETLLEAIEAWGLVKALQRATGMFALALWDKKERQLHLARDRFGEKPLYVGWAGGPDKSHLVFGSELKSLRAHPAFDNAIDRNALALYLRYCHVPAPYSIYENICKLQPGSIATFDSGNLKSGADWQSQAYWRFEDLSVEAARRSYSTEAEATDQLRQALQASVARQLIADVPVGAFLSGGVDSSLIVALMQKVSSKPVNTFTIGFEDAGFNEAPYAAAVASHLGTNHTEVMVSAAQTQAIVPDLPAMYDEPFADSSQIPTSIVCRMARKHVTVALSGDAGDELFAGYNRYHMGPALWNKTRSIPPFARKLAGAGVQLLSAERWDAIANATGLSRRVSQLGDKLHRFGHRLADMNSIDDLYHTTVVKWGAGELPMCVGNRPEAPIEQLTFQTAFESPEHRMMALDTLSYLPDDILVKVDRAAMATSLETRVPFLDHHVAEVAWRMPIEMKLRDGVGKLPLRHLLDEHVPRALIERPKAGFAIPIGKWLRTDLREWAEDLLDPIKMHQEGYLNPEPVAQLWTQHLSGIRDWTIELWTVLMFQAWLRELNN